MTCALGGIRVASLANLFAWANFGCHRRNALRRRSRAAIALNSFAFANWRRPRCDFSGSGATRLLNGDICIRYSAARLMS